MGLSPVAISGSYNDLTDLPTVERGTLVKEVGGSAYGPIETPVDTMRVYPSTGAVTLDGSSVGYLTPNTQQNAMLVTNAQGGTVWQNFVPTGNEAAPVYINSNREFTQCDINFYIGSLIEWSLKDSFTLDGTTNEQTWDLAPLRGWPYGFAPYHMQYSAVVTSPVDMIVRLYEHDFAYISGEFSPRPERLAWVGYLKAGVDSISFSTRFLGLGNNTYLDGGRVTVQPLTATSGTITINAQAGGYNPESYGYTLGSLPAANPSEHWHDPT